MRASVSGLMALLVLWFFPLNIFIHSFIGKQSGESVESVVSPEEEKVGYGGKDLQKRKVLSLE